jgi:preprotein translocase subunit SecE
MFKRIGDFLKQVKVELKKVSWSTRQELIASTWVVITTVALLAVFVGIIDFILSRLISLVIK